MLAAPNRGECVVFLLAGRSEGNDCTGCTGVAWRFAEHRFGFFLLGFKTIPYFDVPKFIGTVI
jgi:hypothetical protein